MKFFERRYMSHKQRTIRFWWRSGSRYGSRNFWQDFLPLWDRRNYIFCGISCLAGGLRYYSIDLSGRDKRNASHETKRTEGMTRPNGAHHKIVKSFCYTAYNMSAGYGWILNSERHCQNSTEPLTYFFSGNGQYGVVACSLCTDIC